MSEFKHAPQSRHEALVPFSRDHYTGLVQAQHLVKAADALEVDRRKAVAEFMDAWDNEISSHFRDEERLLAGLLGEEDRRRMIQEHETLTELARQASKLRKQVDPDPDTLRQIGQRLEQHIRWEERELFHRIQNQLTEQKLAELKRQTAEIEATRPRKS